MKLSICFNENLDIYTEREKCKNEQPKEKKGSKPPEDTDCM